MGFFTRTAMDMLMKTTHPEINRRQCWNLHPHRKPCTECKDICPYGEQIFTRPNLVKDWDSIIWSVKVRIILKLNFIPL